MHATIVKFNALANTVGAAAKHNYFLFIASDAFVVADNCRRSMVHLVEKLNISAAKVRQWQ
jgi:hypothetical protein